MVHMLNEAQLTAELTMAVMLPAKVGPFSLVVSVVNLPLLRKNNSWSLFTYTKELTAHAHLCYSRQHRKVTYKDLPLV